MSSVLFDPSSWNELVLLQGVHSCEIASPEEQHKAGQLLNELWFYRNRFQKEVREKNVKGVVVLVEERLSDRPPSSQNVLAVVRRENPNQKCLPGGSVEERESLFDAALRELREETGLALQPNQLIFCGIFEVPTKDGQGKDHVALFKATFHVSHSAFSLGEPDLNPHWAPIEELCDPEKNGVFSISARYARNHMVGL